MKKYDNKETAPLLYHSIFLCVALPLSVITNTISAVSSFNSLYEDPALFAFVLFDLICEASLAIMSAITFWGLRNWKPYSWYTIQISNIAVFIYNMIVIGIYSISGAFSFNDISQQLASITVAILVSIYYWKRKGIFFSQNVPVAEMAISAAGGTVSASVPEHEEKPAEPSQPTPPPAAQLTPIKKTPKKQTVVLLLFSIALVCSLSFNLYQYSKIQNLDEENDKEVIYWARNYQEAFQNNRSMADYLSEMNDEYFFYHKYAVIVNSTAGTKYHRYGCYHLRDGFYIYNIENAKAQGYTACADCKPDEIRESFRLKKEHIDNLIQNTPTEPAAPYNSQ